LIRSAEAGRATARDSCGWGGHPAAVGALEAGMVKIVAETRSKSWSNRGQMLHIVVHVEMARREEESACPARVRARIAALVGAARGRGRLDAAAAAASTAHLP
jgi:hypothetical protein